MVTGRTLEVLTDKVRLVIEQFLAERGLTLSPEKTKITHITEGFDFLSMNVRKYNGKFLIKPAPKSVKTFLSKVRRTVKVTLWLARTS